MSHSNECLDDTNQIDIFINEVHNDFDMMNLREYSHGGYFTRYKNVAVRIISDNKRMARVATSVIETPRCPSYSQLYRIVGIYALHRVYLCLFIHSLTQWAFNGGLGGVTAGSQLDLIGVYGARHCFSKAPLLSSCCCCWWSFVPNWSYWFNPLLLSMIRKAIFFLKFLFFFKLNSDRFWSMIDVSMIK